MMDEDFIDDDFDMYDEDSTSSSNLQNQNSDVSSLSMTYEENKNVVGYNNYNSVDDEADYELYDESPQNIQPSSSSYGVDMDAYSEQNQSNDMLDMYDSGVYRENSGTDLNQYMSNIQNQYSQQSYDSSNMYDSNYQYTGDNVDQNNGYITQDYNVSNSYYDNNLSLDENIGSVQLGSTPNYGSYNNVDDYLNKNMSVQQPNYVSQEQYNSMDNIVSRGDGISDSSLAPMYEEKNSASYEEALKTATPFASANPVNIPVEPVKEETYSNDFMDYDPMLHNGLETDGDYVISAYDPNANDDYVPEKTNFDSEGVMEVYNEENVEAVAPKEEVKEEVPESYNTAGMMQYDTNNVDTFNGGDKPTETVVTRFIFNDDNEAAPAPAPVDSYLPNNKGSISIYNKDSKKNKSETMKTVEMVGMVVFVALLILLISFFPDINKVFSNFGK